MMFFQWTALAALLGTAAAGAVAAEKTPATPAEPRRLVVDVDFALASINDNALRWSMGRERQIKIGYAVVGLSGQLGAHLSYRMELNGVNDTVKPEPFSPGSSLPFFFPNQPDPAFGVVSKPEGQFKVDDYKNTGWDPYIQEDHLRQAFVDVHTERGQFGLVVGRFFVSTGLPLAETRWFTVKDMTHIQALNAQVDGGGEAYWRFGGEGFYGRLSGAVVTGNGNPYHDYVYFDFTRASAEDTNSAAAVVGALRLWPVKGLDLVLGYEYDDVGSRIESATTVSRSKHYDNKLLAGARYRPRFFPKVQVFGELARYKLGLRETSAELLPGPTVKTPLYKNGYYVGVDLGLPIPGKRGTVGVVLTREELGRDDSLIAFLAARGMLGATLGEKERGTIVKVYADFGPLTAFFFSNSLDNPFPAASAIVATSGPFAFQGPGSGKKGGGIRLKVSF